MTLKDEVVQPSSDVYRTLLESTKAIPWKIDWATMKFAYIGPQIEKLLGWEQASWVSADDWASRMHEEDREWTVNYCVSQSQSGIDHEADYRALTKDGNYVWIRDVVHVVRKPDGEVESLIGFMFDISERKRIEDRLLTLQKELEELSFKDGLTDVPNRRMFDKVLKEEWIKAIRSNQVLSVIMVDIDYFKQYNDLYGHLHGDDCLKQVARILSTCMTHPCDFLARYGGEEFVFVLPDTDSASAEKLAERCRQEVVQRHITHDSGIESQVTVCLGVCSTRPKQGDDPLAFLQCVDDALYQAKANGRNRVEVVSGSSNNGAW